MQTKKILCCYSLNFLLIFSSVPGISKDDQKGKITYIEKKVKQKNSEAEEWKDAQQNNAVVTGDKVKTLVGSRAELQLEGLSTVRLAPKTTVSVAKLFEETKDKKQESTLEIEEGDVWASCEELNEDTKFAVNSKVVGTAIRGTIFRMSVSSDQSAELKVYQGKVAVSNAPQNPNLPIQDLPRHEVSGPMEVAGPTEISMEEWVYLVREMQKIKVKPTGQIDFSGDFSKKDADEQTEWVRWNQMRDKTLDQ